MRQPNSKLKKIPASHSLSQCPYCVSMVRADRLEKHIERVHCTPEVLAWKPASPSRVVNHYQGEFHRHELVRMVRHLVTQTDDGRAIRLQAGALMTFWDISTPVGCDRVVLLKQGTGHSSSIIKVPARDIRKVTQSEFERISPTAGGSVFTVTIGSMD